MPAAATINQTLTYAQQNVYTKNAASASLNSLTTWAGLINALPDTFGAPAAGTVLASVMQWYLPTVAVLDKYGRTGNVDDSTIQEILFPVISCLGAAAASVALPIALRDALIANFNTAWA